MSLILTELSLVVSCILFHLLRSLLPLFLLLLLVVFNKLEDLFERSTQEQLLVFGDHFGLRLLLFLSRSLHLVRYHSSVVVFVALIKQPTACLKLLGG